MHAQCAFTHAPTAAPATWPARRSSAATSVAAQGSSATSTASTGTPGGTFAQTSDGSWSEPWNWIRPLIPASVNCFMQPSTLPGSTFASQVTRSTPAVAAWVRMPSLICFTYGTRSPYER